MLQERAEKLVAMERAASHSATHYTEAAWGAEPGEPLPEFPKALRRIMLDLGAPQDLANKMVNTGENPSEGEKGNTGGKRRGCCEGQESWQEGQCQVVKGCLDAPRLAGASTPRRPAPGKGER